MRSSQASGKAGKSPVKSVGALPAADRGVSGSFPVVGVGASAGGLEAFTAFLKALSPEPGIGLVFVTHLDPHRESSFAQILARATKMRVRQIERAVRVEVNCVYVIPPNCDLTIVGSVLHIEDRHEPRTVNMGIDIFFRSLAHDQGKNAIGVILSGTGSDGTLGLAAIKGEGGITFAQDPHTAKYDSMPSNAVTSGHVDFVFSPEGLAQELENIRKRPYVHEKAAAPELAGESPD
jgi:two-component system CheB/CheR fusion protein